MAMSQPHAHGKQPSSHLSATRTRTNMSRTERQQELLEVFSHIGYPLRSVDARQLDRDDTRLRGLGKLPRGEEFSSFNPDHMAEAKAFYTILLGARDFADFVKVAFTAREILNEQLFVFGASWAALDSSLCQGLLAPPIHEIFPDKFIPSDTITRAMKLYLDRITDAPITVTMDPTGTNLDEEQRLAYFREDLGLNSHHWHWHLVYPNNGPTKDRKGELFYYMHQQMCARYDCERLSVGLKLVEAMYDFDEPMIGYAPHLMILSCGKSHASRPDGMRLKEVNHLVRWRERIMEAIHQNYLIDQRGNHIPLNDESGIDLLGAVVEASADSKNSDFYGNLHNMIHNGIASVHDPIGKFKQLNGVIGESTTAVRDPIFFKLHRFIDDLFNEHKITFSAYTRQELLFPGIVIGDVVVEGRVPNVIFTHMRKATMELNHAIRMKISVMVEYEHLDHEPFVYTIKVNNMTSSNKVATVRIFMAPKYDSTGQEFPLGTQRRFFIEMDKFRTTLTPGENAISRNSSESAVTLVYVPSFKELKEKPVIVDKQGRNITDTYCSCGWPQHLLVPKGTPRGMDFKLCVMLTDYQDDAVADEVRGEPKCKESVSYCGLKDQKYPDKKAMGFPFDRTITEPIAGFATPNMKFTDIKVQFTGLKLVLGNP